MEGFVGRDWVRLGDIQSSVEMCTHLLSVVPAEPD